MKPIQIKSSLFFKLYDCFVYGNLDYHDDIRNELMEKMEKMQLRKLYTDSLTAPTEEEREAARTEYLKKVSECGANTIVNLFN